MTADLLKRVGHKVHADSGMVMATMPRKSSLHTAFTSATFNLSDPASFSAAMFAIDYDDGYVAYLSSTRNWTKQCR